MPKVVLVLVPLLCLPAVLSSQERPRAADFVERAKSQLGGSMATTADEVIRRHVAALGGEAALRATRTLVYRARNLRLSTEVRPIVRYLRQPAMLRQETPGSAAFVLSDGSKVFSVRPEGRTEQPQAWARLLARERIDGDFLDYRARGIAYEYLGLEGLDTEPTVFYHLKRTYPDGYFEDLYFDVESHLLRRARRGTDGTSTLFYDYRDAGGLLFPCLHVRLLEPSSPPHVLVVDEVTRNGPCPDSLFEGLR